MSGPGPAPGPSSLRLSRGQEEPGSVLLCRLRYSEAKRLELERKLMEYRKSDAYLMRLKYTKLKKYLKEIDERQKGALLRNQTFLKEFKQFEAHMETSGSAMIQKMEAWYRREIKSALSLQEGNLSEEGDKEEDYGKQVPQVGSQSVIGTETAVPRGLYHSATVFIGCHTSASLADGALGTQQKPPQSTESHTAPNPPLCSPLLEGLSPESRSANLECDESVEGAVRHGDLSASEEGSEQLTSSASDPKLASPKEERLWGSVPGSKPRLTDWWTSKEENWESSDELLVPVSTKEVMLNTSDPPQETASPAASCEQDRDALDSEGSSQQFPKAPAGQGEPSASSAPDRHGGMLARLSPALQLIEDMVVRGSPQHRALYQGQHVGTTELLSFCSWDKGLKEDDLEACEAVVLHQLRALLQSMPNSCLLPEETLEAEGTAVDEKQSRPDLPWDANMLRTRLSHHASFLRKHQVQLPDDVAGMFESLMVSSERMQDIQALPMLSEVLPEECGDRSSLQSNESSRSLPAFPNNVREIKQMNHAPQLASTGEQEVTSWCEDESKEESAVVKIPITGWGSSDNSSKSQEVHSDTSSPSKEQSPLFSRTEMRKAAATAIKSKAFWGESDDSSSEIEAALCPQTGSLEDSNDFDFYD